jgi:carboxypeptidase D
MRHVSLPFLFLALAALVSRRRIAVEAIRRLPNDKYHDDPRDIDMHRQLVGANVDVPIPASPEGHLVTELPLLAQGAFPTKHWAGLLPASAEGDKYFFYWLFAPDNVGTKADADIPLLIWLNGGPACSSMDGLWLENGPFRLTNKAGNWAITADPHSWHKAPAYVVYIDQPVGTGISFTTSAKYPKNDPEINTDFYYFLQEFLNFHQDKFLTQDQDQDNQSTAFRRMKRGLYFSGESHAGHYIPSMMNFIRKQNEIIDALDKGNAQKHNIVIPLKGAAIGNGWFDPRFQYAAHEAAYGHGIIGRAERQTLAQQEIECQEDLAKGKYVSSPCFELLDSVIDNSAGEKSPYIVSSYDVTKWERSDAPRSFPPGHEMVEAYLGGWGVPAGQPKLKVKYETVLHAIHASPSLTAGQRFKECTNPPYNALKHQDGLGVTKDIVELLNHKPNSGNRNVTNGEVITMLFFNGMLDLICNHVGNEIGLENLEWNHQNKYMEAKRYGWKSAATNQLAGYVKQYGNLIFLKLSNSGHMVPLDIPDVGLEMMQQLMHVTPTDQQSRFQTYAQSIARSLVPLTCPLCSAVVTPNKDDRDSGGKECAICPACDEKQADAAADPAAASTPVVGRDRGLIAVLLSIIMCLSCWIFMGGRGRLGRGHGKLNGVTARKSEILELTLTNGSLEYDE